MEVIKFMLLVYIAMAVHHIIDNQVVDYEEYKNIGIKCKEAK